MQKNIWVSQVLMDIEKYCYENGLQEVAACLADAQQIFSCLQDEEISTAVHDNENVEPLRLVCSKPD